ncbi:MAG: M24 family metallopeptidase [Actinomycetota bacterium]
MDHPDRRRRLAARLDELQAEAFLVTHLPNVRYLTGFSGSNAQLLVTSSDGVLFTDGRYDQQAAHEVPDIPREIYSGEFGPAFARACERFGVSRVAFESAAVSHRTYSRLADGVELVPTEEEVERLRCTKSPDEVASLDAAQEIADQAFQIIVGKLAEGMTERQVALELDFAMRQAAADGVAFDTIVAFGENAAEPHHHPGPRPLTRGDIVKLDFGCVVDGYHSDMTRTVAFGPPESRLEEIHGIVRRAQEAGIDALHAGAVAGDVDAAARTVIADAGYGKHYVHSLGHGVGLEIHEGPILRAGSRAVVPERAVVTVEPGVYVAGLGGVRIEDMVEVTAAGCRAIPRTPRDLLVL